MVEIVRCCKGMETMIEDGTIQPFTAFGKQTAQVVMKGKNEAHLYNEVTNCLFCGTEIRLA
jgi:hypothetical protein